MSLFTIYSDFTVLKTTLAPFAAVVLNCLTATGGRPNEDSKEANVAARSNLRVPRGIIAGTFCVGKCPMREL